MLAHLVRLAYAYDRLAPETLGGAERYYQTLCAGLAGDDEVTYLTRRWWRGAERGQQRDGVEVIAVDDGIVDGYGGKLVYAAALAWHLRRHGDRYDVVHACCFPYTTVLAAWLGLRRHPRPQLIVDWHEVLTRATWHQRRGRAGLLAWYLQRLALRRGDAAVTFSRMHADRLASEGCFAPIEVHPEFHPTGAPAAVATGAAREPVIVFAGRLEAEKRPALLPAVVARLRRHDPAWRAVIFGAGPEEGAIREAARREGVEDAVELAGFVPWPEVSRTMLSARALVLPTMREGFGLAVLEAAAHGLPSVLVDGPDNAAVELVEPGRNGVVVAVADAGAIARAVLELTAVDGIHERSRAWFDEVGERLSVPAAVDAARALHARLVV